MVKEGLVVSSFRAEVFMELLLNLERKMFLDLFVWFSGLSYQSYYNLQKDTKCISEYQPKLIQEEKEYK